MLAGNKYVVNYQTAASISITVSVFGGSRPYNIRTPAHPPLLFCRPVPVMQRISLAIATSNPTSPVSVSNIHNLPSFCMCVTLLLRSKTYVGNKEGAPKILWKYWPLSNTAKIGPNLKWYICLFIVMIHDKWYMKCYTLSM